MKTLWSHLLQNGKLKIISKFSWSVEESSKQALVKMFFYQSGSEENNIL